MPYVTSVERIGLEKGLQQGRQEGLQEGRQEGELLFLKRLLIQKFGPLTPDVDARLTAASIAELEAWGDRLLGADSLEDVFNVKKS
ncbi:MAG: DUF4351 domain-containing protein [Synechocystis sp.]|nr:DUF4351 domain-containing protein [Synechocystis sp.]